MPTGDYPQPETVNVGWQCPNCGSAHPPHVQTCPMGATHPVRFYPSWPIYPMNPVWINPIVTTCQPLDGEVASAILDNVEDLYEA